MLLIIVGIYVNTQKEKILKVVNQELEEKLMGHVSIKGIDISLWRNFPSISIRLKDISFTDTLFNQPMLSAKIVASTFSPFDLIGSKKEINDIIVEDGVLHIFKDSSGYSNNYVLKPYPDENKKVKKKNNSSIQIEQITLKNLDVSMIDKIANKEFGFLINTTDASLKQHDSVMNFLVDENILMKKGLGFNLEKGAYLENQIVKGEWDLKYNVRSKTLSFDKTKVLIADVPFFFSGFFATGEDPHFKLNIHSDAAPFSIVKASVTNHIRKKLDKIEIQKPLLADAVIEGSLLPRTKPAVNISWETKDNVLSTNDASFTKCSFAGKFDNHINKDSINDDKNTKIIFSSFSGDLDGIFLSGEDIRITNLIDPYIKFNLHSKCTFAQLENKIALKSVRFIEGDAELLLFYEGQIKNDISFIEEIEGKLTVKNGSIEYVPHNFVFSNCNGEISFLRDSISISKFNCNYKQNKFNLEASGKNIRRKFVVGDTTEDVMIKCLVTSPFINMEDFKPIFAGNKQRTKLKQKKSFLYTAKKFDALLDNSEIHILIKANEIHHQNLVARDFDAEIRFAPRQWQISRVSFNVAGGNISLLGKINPGNNNNHLAAISAKVYGVDVKKLMYSFDNFGQDAITHHHLSGTATMDVKLNTGINSQGKIMPSSLFGTVNFSIKNGGLKDYPPLANIKTFLLKNRDLTDVRFAELKDRLDIKGTDIYINRMEIASNVIRLFIEGNYGLNGKNTDMLIHVLLSNLNSKNFDQDSAPVNKGIKSKEGSSILLRAVNGDDGKVKLKPTLSKKIDQPGKTAPETKKKKKFLIF